jgi:hypothetical protein
MRQLERQRKLVCRRRICKERHGLPGVQFLDMTDEVCPASICPAVRQMMFVYRDRTHLTGTFVRSLVPAIETRLRSAFALASLSPDAADDRHLNSSGAR